MPTPQKIETEFKNLSGICLLLGSLLATLAMTMHPTGGDIAHIVRIKNVLTFSHSIAIFCLPVVGFGFWGLTSLLQTKSKISVLAFTIFLFGLIAAMIAATINGFTLPYFASNYSTDENNISTVKLIAGYGKYINIPMAIIFIVAASLAITVWSVLIIQTKQIPGWLGILGLAIVSLGAIGLFFEFNFTNVFGFRTYIFGLVCWKVAIGISMLKMEHN